MYERLVARGKISGHTQAAEPLSHEVHTSVAGGHMSGYRAPAPVYGWTRTQLQCITLRSSVLDNVKDELGQRERRATVGQRERRGGTTWASLYAES